MSNQNNDMFPGAMPTEVGRNELAHILGVTPNRVTQLKADGIPFNDGRGRYPLAEAVQWVIQYWKTKSHQAGSENLSAHRKRLLEAQAKKAEIDNDLRLKELIPAEIIGSTINQVAVIVASQLDALAPRLSNELTNQSDSAYIKKVINDETRQIRNAVANLFDDLADFENGGENSETAADKNGE